MRIAFLEDDPAQMALVSSWISEAGHDYTHFQYAKKFLQSIQRETYDLAILDWELPDMLGDEIIRTVRVTLDLSLPIICITVRDEEENIVNALRLGADDYMKKPLSKNEFLARVTALSRRTQRSIEPHGDVDFPPYRFEIESHTAFCHDEAIALTDKEFLLAKLLFQNAGRMLSRTFLLETVWGTRGDLDTRTVDTHMSRVRKKLGLNPDKGWRLTSVYKFGYRLEKTAGNSLNVT